MGTSGGQSRAGRSHISGGSPRTAIPAPVWSLCQCFTTITEKIFFLILNKNSPSPAHARSFSFHPCVPLKGDWAHFMFCIPAPKGRQSTPPALMNARRQPPSPSGHCFFFPREGRESKLRRGRSTHQGILLHRALWLQKPSPQRLTPHTQPGSDLPAAGPGLLSSSIRRHPPTPPPPTVVALLGTANYNRSRFQQGGSSKPTCTAGQTGASGSWGTGCVVWQGQLFLQTLLLPRNAAGRKMKGGMVAG